MSFMDFNGYENVILTSETHDKALQKSKVPPDIISYD